MPYIVVGENIGKFSVMLYVRYLCVSNMYIVHLQLPSPSVLQRAT